MLFEILIPIILIIGSLGNLVNFYVFTRPSVKGLSTFRFLAYLSIIDFFYLIIGLPHIMTIVYTGYDFRNYSDLICSLHSFFTLYLSHISSNILAGVSVFRCVTLTTLRPVKAATVNKTIHSHRSNHLNHTFTNALNNNSMSYLNEKSVRINCSSRKTSAKLELSNVSYGSNKKSCLRRFAQDFGNADIIILAIMFIIFLFDCHFLIWMRLAKDEDSIIISNSTNLSKMTFKLRCYPSNRDQAVYFEFYTQAYHWIDLFLYSYIPFAIMIVCTVLIIFRLFQINKRLKPAKPVKEKCLMLQEIQLSAVTIDSNSDMKPKGSKNIKFSSKSSNVSKQPKLRKNVTNNDLAKRRSRKNSQIYKLLLTLNVFFFVLVTPLVLSNSLGLLKQDDQLLFELVYILSYLNHCLDFLFYGLSCKIYRNILIDYFRDFSFWV